MVLSMATPATGYDPSTSQPRPPERPHAAWTAGSLSASRGVQPDLDCGRPSLGDLLLAEAARLVEQTWQAYLYDRPQQAVRPCALAVGSRNLQAAMETRGLPRDVDVVDDLVERRRRSPGGAAARLRQP